MLLAASPFQVSGQKRQVKESSDVIKDDIQFILETIAELTDENFNFDAFLEQLTDMLRKPLNLNKATYTELEDLQLLSSAEILQNIVRHRQRFGKFISIHELQAVESLDLEAIRRILPFVTVKTDLDDYRITSLKQLLTEGTYELFFRYSQVLEEQRGYIPLEEGQTGTRYPGHPSRIYSRFRYSFPNKLSFGFTVEKDAGEEVFGSTQPRGFDFYSGHIFVRNAGIFKHIAIGDYDVRVGQGLVMWSGFGFGKSPLVTNTKKTSEALRPYTSVDENLFLRGIATTVEAGNFEITGFFSRDRKDASIAQIDTTDEEVAIVAEASSLQESGLHRTPGELRGKNAITQTLAGGYLKYKRRSSHIPFPYICRIFP